ncbi:relaxase/mobilization nuclease domain-containing protein (plasmid) [Fusobacterium polymorphum]|uniref:relaxase/mobilization nuclease domain-containing protein n=1 Tax=Fusobacterium nucleatum subsp. polymorphum TaxID=76857 RepID=UPI0031382DDC
MQIIFKIGEFKPKKKADLINVFKYITRESAVYKAKGIGVSSNPDIAVRQFMINKRKHKKAVDEKYRFAYHEILSFEAGTDPELAYKIAEDYCKNLHYKKGFNCYFAIQTDTDNVHAHILVDSVNFKTGNMLISENEKELEKRPELKNKIEFYSLEQQMKFAEDMAIKNGYQIEDEKRYAFMHEAKKNDKNARKWLSKNQYQAFKKEQEKDEDKSWRNVIKEKIEAMYKRADITEQNIGEIAREYGLEVTRHNVEKQTITLALLDTEGKRTKQRLKLVEQINKKKKKGEEVAEEDVKLAIKMERLEDQEKGNFASEDMNIFTYSNFFRNREKEKDLEQDNKELLEILDITSKDKEKVLEKEKEKELHSTSKEEVAVADEKAKASTDDDLMGSLEKIAIALSKKPKYDNRPKIFDKLKDFKEITSELETLEFERDHRLTYNSKDFEKDLNNAVYLAFYSLISRKVEFNNQKETDRANEIMQNIEKNTTDENIRRNLDLVNQLIIDNKKEYERLKKNNFREEVAVAEVETKTNKLTELEMPRNDTPNNLTKVEIVRNNEEIEVTEIEAETETNKLTELEMPRNDTPNNLTKDNIVRNDEEMELELSIKKLSNHYGDIIEKYHLYDSLPAFQVYTDNLIFDRENNYNIADDYVTDLKGIEFWDNMVIKDIREWEKLKSDDEEISIIYKDKDNEFTEFTDYTEYAEETVVNYLKKHKEKIKELELEYRPASQVKQVNKNTDNKDIEKKGEKEYEYGD